MEANNKAEHAARIRSLKGRTFTLVVGEGVAFRERFEYAAWYKLHQLKPGTYTFTLTDEELSNSSARWWDETATTYVTVPSTVIEQDMRSRYGGVAISKYEEFEPYEDICTICMFINPKLCFDNQGNTKPFVVENREVFIIGHQDNLQMLPEQR